ncbi:3-deoxy-7-phosphoheptulonate synthase, partial [Gammaproteobacteria bacterium AH-315-E17]|nr:3-deoxy-7-phosphoheptulonate synthase [Gammaproteobacteria bacterium AH-315-E17]
AAAEKMQKSDLNPAIIVDCSHANSGKDPDRQVIVCQDVAGQIANGETSIKGVMLESHLVAGNQKVIAGEPLTYGQSITDACMSWEDTDALLNTLAKAVTNRRN